MFQVQKFVIYAFWFFVVLVVVFLAVCSSFAGRLIFSMPSCLSDGIAPVSLDISQSLSEEGPGVVILFCR